MTREDVERAGEKTAAVVEEKNEVNLEAEASSRVFAIAIILNGDAPCQMRRPHPECMPSSGAPTGHVYLIVTACYRYDFTKKLLCLYGRIADA